MCYKFSVLLIFSLISHIGASATKLPHVLAHAVGEIVLPWQMYVFMTSWRRAVPDAKIIIFSDKSDSLTALIAHNLGAVIVPASSDGKSSVNVQRLHDYIDFLEAHADEVWSTAVVDCRDTYVQRDPFAVDFRQSLQPVDSADLKKVTSVLNTVDRSRPSEDGVLITTEGGSALINKGRPTLIGAQSCNRDWVKKCFGKKARYKTIKIIYIL